MGIFQIHSVRKAMKHYRIASPGYNNLLAVRFCENSRPFPQYPSDSTINALWCSRGNHMNCHSYPETQAYNDIVLATFHSTELLYRLVLCSKNMISNFPALNILRKTKHFFHQNAFFLSFCFVIVISIT